MRFAKVEGIDSSRLSVGDCCEVAACMLHIDGLPPHLLVVVSTKNQAVDTGSVLYFRFVDDTTYEFVPAMVAGNIDQCITGEVFASLAIKPIVFPRNDQQILGILRRSRLTIDGIDMYNLFKLKEAA